MPTSNTREGIEQVFSTTTDILDQITLCWGAGRSVLCIVGSFTASLAETPKHFKYLWVVKQLNKAWLINTVKQLIVIIKNDGVCDYVHWHGNMTLTHWLRKQVTKAYEIGSCLPKRIYMYMHMCARMYMLVSSKGDGRRIGRDKEMLKG